MSPPEQHLEVVTQRNSNYRKACADREDGEEREEVLKKSNVCDWWGGGGSVATRVDRLEVESVKILNSREGEYPGEA